MRIRSGLLMGLGLSAIAFLWGCSQQPPAAAGGEQGDANAATIRDLMNRAEHNAAVSERAVYPHDFAPHEAVLNELGEARVQSLATAYMSAPGELVIIQGDAPPQLYRARVKAVLDWLATAGVDTARMTVSEQFPGGAGISSSRAVRALAEDRTSPQNRTYGASQGSAQSRGEGK